MIAFLRNGVSDSEASDIIAEHVMQYVEPINRPEIEQLKLQRIFQIAIIRKIRQYNYRTPGLLDLPYDANSNVTVENEMQQKLRIFASVRIIAAES